MQPRRACPNQNCRHDLGAPSRVVKAGKFHRKEDGQSIQRFVCRRCGRHFSTATFSDAYRQKNRRINDRVRKLLCIKVSQRAIARYLRINRKTVARRLRFLGNQARCYFDGLQVRDLSHVQFDEMQSSIHTKCKPVAIPMAVDANTRTILALKVASMPAQHPLVDIAMRKYGPRADHRPEAIAQVLRRIQPMLKRGAQISTDMAPRYPAPIQRLLPGVSHVAVRSRRACVTGQGELKRVGFDPLFSFNHTAAMVRDGVSRLVRKTWGNSKRADCLENHLLIYAHYHNTERLKVLPLGA